MPWWQCVIMCEQRALKTQKFTAWGSVPGNTPTNLLSRYRRKSSEALSQGSNTCTHYCVNRKHPIYQAALKGNTYGYFYRKQAASRPSE